MISVIIPCLNEAKALPLLLASLQSVRDRIEIIVVDGGSIDGTADIARPLADAVITQNKGRALQMNTGAAVAKGDVLWFVHADTGFTAPLVDCLVELEACQHWGFFGLRLSGSQWYFRIIGQMISWCSRLQGIATGDQGIFVKADVFKRLGGYPAIPLMEDLALSKQLRAQAIPCVSRLKLVTSSRRWEHRGVIATVLLMWQLRFLYFVGVKPERLAKRYH